MRSSRPRKGEAPTVAAGGASGGEMSWQTNFAAKNTTSRLSSQARLASDSLDTELAATSRAVNSFEDDVKRTLASIHASLTLAMFARATAEAGDAELLNASIRAALTNAQASFGALQDRIAMGVHHG